MKRAIALLQTEHTPTQFEALVLRNGLRIVYTIRTDTRAVLAALIATQHALEHVAEAVVIPHLGFLEPDAPWWVITTVADLITGTRVYPSKGSASRFSGGGS
ncbi:hypothetical protein AB0F65_20720 [Nocardia rhamnosiphila]|uniref:hypothetical protein n=1 Tax=Nocardia rhamnosiphila TaxID=426716 RepID=UPI0033FC5107